MKATKQLVNGIRVYSRHSSDCGREPAYVKCECPKWLQFQLGKKQIREAAGTRYFSQAAKVAEKKAKELSGEAGPEAKGISVEKAVEDWLQHREQEKIDNKKAKLMTDKFIAFCRERGILLLSSVTRAHLNAFKLTLPFASGNSNSLRVHLSVLGGFFRWATEENGSLAANPFPQFKLKFKADDVVIPTTEEINRVLAIPSVRLFASLLRYSGMAIQDAATLKRSCLVENVIKGKRLKTGKKFRVEIPLWLADELRAIPPKDARYFFWDGKIQGLGVAQNFRTMLCRSFELAEVEMTPHSFRHYFISKALAAGVPLGDVADMAGSSPAEIWKTYRHFIAEAEQRSHTMHQQMWAAAGLDEKGNPQTR